MEQTSETRRLLPWQPGRRTSRVNSVVYILVIFAFDGTIRRLSGLRR